MSSHSFSAQDLAQTAMVMPKALQVACGRRTSGGEHLSLRQFSPLRFRHRYLSARH